MSRISIVSKVAAGAAALAAAGGGAYVLTAQNTSSSISSFTSASTSPSVSTVSPTGSVAAHNGMHKHHRRVPEHAVITYFNKTAGDVTVTEDSGIVSAVSSSSMTVTHSDGTTAVIPLTATTKFGRGSLSQLETDATSATPPRVLVIEKGGSAVRVMVLGQHKMFQGAANGAPATAG